MVIALWFGTIVSKHFLSRTECPYLYIIRQYGDRMGSEMRSAEIVLVTVRKAAVYSKHQQHRQQINQAGICM